MEIDPIRGSDPSLERSDASLDVEARGLTPADTSSPIRTTCPYCGVGCGVLADARRQGRCRDPRRSRASGQRRPAVLEGLGARRDAGARDAAAPPHRRRRADELGPRARSGRQATASRSGRRTGPRRSPSTSRASCSPRTITSPTSWPRASSARRTSTPTRGCACPPRSPAIAAHSAPTWCRSATTTWSWPTSSCWRAPTRRGATRSSTSASRPRAASAACASSTSIRAAPRPAKASTCSCRSGPAATARFGRACWCGSPSTAQSTPSSSARTRKASSRPCGLRAPSRRGSRPSPPQPASTSATSSASSTGSPRTPRVVSCYSQGVNQSAQGTDKVNAILNCHLATGRIGKPGSGPLSLTGQPNAMGGREVGGLANMLAAHMGFSDAERDRVRRFWKAPNLVDRRRPQGRRHVRRGRRRAHQGAVGHGHQPGRVAAARRRDARGAVAARAAGRVRQRRLQRHVGSRAHRLARGGVGREGRHRHQLGAVHLAPARVPAASRARPARLVDAERGGAAPGPRRRLRLSLGRRHLRRARAPVGLRERRQPRLRHLRPLPASRDEAFDELAPFQWPCARRRRADASASSATAASSRATARPASWRSPSRALPLPSRRRGRSSSTPVASATSGTP